MVQAPFSWSFQLKYKARRGETEFHLRVRTWRFLFACISLWAACLKRHRCSCTARSQLALLKPSAFYSQLKAEKGQVLGLFSEDTWIDLSRTWRDKDTQAYTPDPMFLCSATRVLSSSTVSSPWKRSNCFYPTHTTAGSLAQPFAQGAFTFPGHCDRLPTSRVIGISRPIQFDPNILARKRLCRKPLQPTRKPVR